MISPTHSLQYNYYLDDGREYSGNWLNERPNGFGLMKYPLDNYTMIFISTIFNNGLPQFHPNITQNYSNNCLKAKIILKLDLKTDHQVKVKHECIDLTDDEPALITPPFKLNYSGQLLNNKKHGQGAGDLSETVSFEGKWANDLPDGPGIMTFKLLQNTLVSIQGTFRNAIPLSNNIIVTGYSENSKELEVDLILEASPLEIPPLHRTEEPPLSLERNGSAAAPNRSIISYPNHFARRTPQVSYSTPQLPIEPCQSTYPSETPSPSSQDQRIRSTGTQNMISAEYPWFESLQSELKRKRRESRKKASNESNKRARLKNQNSSENSSHSVILPSIPAASSIVIPPSLLGSFPIQEKSPRMPFMRQSGSSNDGIQTLQDRRRYCYYPNT